MRREEAGSDLPNECEGDWVGGDGRDQGREACCSPPLSSRRTLLLSASVDVR